MLRLFREKKRIIHVENSVKAGRVEISYTNLGLSLPGSAMRYYGAILRNSVVI